LAVAPKLGADFLPGPLHSNAQAGRKPGTESLSNEERAMVDLDKFDVVLKRSGGQVRASVPQLGIVAVADDPLSALDEVERKKAELKDDLAKSGVVEDFTAADPFAIIWSVIRQRRDDLRRMRVPAVVSEIGRFAVKAAIVACLITGALVFTGNLLAQKLEGLFARVEGSVERIEAGTRGRALWARLERGLEGLAAPENELPEERKQKLLSDIRIIATRWKPFVAEARGLILDERKLGSESTEKPGK
jgi:hypothetical protein